MVGVVPSSLPHRLRVVRPFSVLRGLFVQPTKTKSPLTPQSSANSFGEVPLLGTVSVFGVRSSEGGRSDSIPRRSSKVVSRQLLSLRIGEETWRGRVLSHPDSGGVSSFDGVTG